MEDHDIFCFTFNRADKYALIVNEQTWFDHNRDCD